MRHRLTFELFVTPGGRSSLNTSRQASSSRPPPAPSSSRPPAPLAGVAGDLAGSAYRACDHRRGTAAALTWCSRSRWISISPTRLKPSASGFLLFTLCYLGWYAQGQLSVVQLTGAVRRWRRDRAWAAPLRSGVAARDRLHRADFRGVGARHVLRLWPFGALQEFAAPPRRRLGLKPNDSPRAPCGCSTESLPAPRGLAAGRSIAPRAVERMVEVRTVQDGDHGRLRSWPLPRLRAGIAGAQRGLQVFCRYVCPLGAAMTLGGKLRLPDWLPRRAEMWQAMPKLSSPLPVRRDRALGRDPLRRLLPVSRLCRDLSRPGRCAPVMLELKRLRPKAREATGMSGANAQ